MASLRKWVTCACDSGAVWGECQGSGARPYQVHIELSEPAFKCSCPSRKFPCKHSLGLMLLWAADGLKDAPRPAWVEEWLASRAERAKKKQEKAETPPKPVDAEAQAKRRVKRQERIGEGIASLRIWTEDLIRSGIATVPSQGYALFDEPARRMIDAQAPGAARMVRDLGSTAMSGAGWQEPFLRQLASLHLLTIAFERMEQLPSPTAEDVLAAAGVPRAQEEVLSLPGVTDRWQVMGQEVELEDRLRVQRTWLFGVTGNRPAVVLHFAHGTGPLDASLQSGTVFEGELCFFGDNQTRAAVKTRSSPQVLAGFSGFESLDPACAAYGGMLARQPWLGEVGLPVRSVVPARLDQQWVLLDGQQQMMEMNCTEALGWVLVALSGGQPVDLAVGFDGKRARPLSAIAGGQYVSLAGSEIQGT